MEGPKRSRLTGIDALRGLVMVLMALDHVRDYYGRLQNPLDVEHASAALFFTRWVTHLCAPTFVLLAGMGAWLYEARGATRKELSLFLLTRGLWLIALELTVITFGWLGNYPPPVYIWQVVAAIGMGMVVLSGLVWLPRRVLVVLALALVFGHNLLDPIRPEGSWAGPWRFLHEGALKDFGVFQVLGQPLLVVYPNLPWIGVLALGFVLGPFTALEPARRRRAFLGLGVATIVGFLLLRGWNGYGDPVPWSAQDPAWRTALSFLNCEKYPPSLAYLAMTLGPAFLFLWFFDREPATPGERARPLERISSVLSTYGRVPLFYYVAHIFLIRWSSEVVHRITFGEPVSFIWAQMTGQVPPGFTAFGLGWVWVAWLAIVAALYLPCRWYAGVKKRSRSKLLSYL